MLRTKFELAVKQQIARAGGVNVAGNEVHVEVLQGFSVGKFGKRSVFEIFREKCARPDAK